MHFNNVNYCFKIILFGILLRYNREEKRHFEYLKIWGNSKIDLEMSWDFCSEYTFIDMHRSCILINYKCIFVCALDYLAMSR